MIGATGGLDRIVKAQEFDNADDWALADVEGRPRTLAVGGISREPNGWNIKVVHNFDRSYKPITWRDTIGYGRMF